MCERIERIGHRVSVLVGLSFWGMGRAADLQWFHFGGKHAVVGPHGQQKLVGDWAFHVQCAWRVVQAGTILVASGDHGDQPWADLRTAALREVLNTNPPVVNAVDADAVGSLHIRFSGGYELEIFPDTSLLNLEHWRLFEPNRQTEHYVVGGRDATKD